MFSSLFSNIITFLIDTISAWGYFGIFILMAIESSIFPLPSEIVLIPAGVALAQAKMSFFPLLIASILGSVVGALFNYYLALFLGRSVTEAFISKYGRAFCLRKETLRKSDEFFKNHGEIATFLGRLVLGVRHLISLPAGFSRMHIGKFCIYTALGAGIWSAVLIGVGYFFGNNLSFVQEHLSLIAVSFLAFSLIVLIIYLLYRKKKAKKM